jgi:hypothetical protein
MVQIKIHPDIGHSSPWEIKKISQNETEPILSKLTCTQGVEIDLKATICTRNNNFQNKG